MRWELHNEGRWTESFAADKQTIVASGDAQKRPPTQSPVMKADFRPRRPEIKIPGDRAAPGAQAGAVE